MPVSKENKVTLWLIALCLLFGIHFNFENTGGTGLEVPYNNFTWMFVCLILSSGLWHIAKHQQWKKDTSLYLIGFIILAMIIPILFQEFHAPSSAGLRVLGITTGLLVTLLSVQNFRSQYIWNTFLYILAGAGALEATLCLIQQYLPDVAAYGVYKPDYGRPFGSFQQPNVSATFIATGLSAALYLVITKHTSTPSSNPQASSPSVKKSLEYLLPLTAFLSANALPLLGSRAGILSAITVLIFATPSALKYLKNETNSRPLLLWFGALLLGTGIAIASIQAITTGGRNIESFQSTDNRQGIYAQSFEMILEKPLSGWGYGNFESSFLNYYAKKFSEGHYTHPLVANLDHPHNELLLWAVEGGLAPTLLLLLFSIYLIFRVLSTLKLRNGLLTLGLILPLSTHANTEYPFYQSISHWLVFSLLIGYLLWLTRPIQTENNSQQFKLPFFTRCFAVIIPIVVIPLLVINLQAIYQVTKFHAHRANDLSHLEKVIYPGSIWKRFFFDVMTLKLKNGIKEKDTTAIKSYILWATEFVNHTPRSAIYLNLANAYWALGYPEKSISTLEKAVYLFPQRTDLQKVLMSTKDNWKNFQEQAQRQKTDKKKQPD